MSIKISVTEMDFKITSSDVNKDQILLKINSKKNDGLSSKNNITKHQLNY